jgi:hypothetical protein
MLFAIVQTVYWLALSSWFGGVVFVAVSAPLIFRAVREYNPILPTVLSVNLEGQHATLLAGTIVATLVKMLVRVELGCAGVILLASIGQGFILDLSETSERAAFLVRGALFVVAVALVIYDWRVLWPRIWKSRQDYLDHADEPDVANPAREQFNQHQQQSVTLMSIMLFLLLGMILFSALIAPPGHHELFPSH